MKVLTDHCRITSYNVCYTKLLRILKLTNNSNLIDDELREFLHSFDSVFLNIYPTFVEEFNHLLMKDKQIQPKSA